MTEIIDRAAKAMADRAGLIWNVLPDKADAACGHGMPEGCKDHWRNLACVAIESMIEPTDNMLIRGSAAAEVCDDGWETSATWMAMINAAVDGQAH